MVTQRGLWGLRGCPRHGGHVANEYIGASPLLLSLIATAGSLPFFLFTLPAGALADLSDRRNMLIAVYLWLAAAAGLLAVCTWLHWVHPYVILTTVFLLGIGFAFNAPVWASVVPEIVQKEELASAITLGGVQMNLGGMLGPAERLGPIIYTVLINDSTVTRNKGLLVSPLLVCVPKFRVI